MAQKAIVIVARKTLTSTELYDMAVDEYFCLQLALRAPRRRTAPAIVRDIAAAVIRTSWAIDAILLFFNVDHY